MKTNYVGVVEKIRMLSMYPKRNQLVIEKMLVRKTLISA